MLPLLAPPLTIPNSAAKNATTSPFLKLPPEIRQRIYGYALGGRILHVASGPISGPNSVVVCMNSDDFTNGLNQRIIRDGTFGVRPVKNRGVTHLQLWSHDRCYRGEETWSLDLLKVCRQIYHEGKQQSYHSNLSPQKPFLIVCSGPRAFQEERLRGRGRHHTESCTPTPSQLPGSPRPGSSKGHRISHLAGKPHLRSQKTYARTPQGPPGLGVHTCHHTPKVRHP